MNSLLQLFYMIPELRAEIFALEDELLNTAQYEADLAAGVGAQEQAVKPPKDAIKISESAVSELVEMMVCSSCSHFHASFDFSGMFSSCCNPRFGTVSCSGAAG